MRFTRQVFSRRFSGFAVVACGAVSGASVNCAGDDDGVGIVAPDAEAASNLRDAGVDEAPASDGSPRDATPFDASPPVIECASAKCAVSLTSTSSGDAQSYCALLHDGTVACWGANNDGQLGRGDEAGTGDSAAPMRVIGLSNIVNLERTCAVDSQGSIYCWGKGPYLKEGAPVTTERTPLKLPITRAKDVSVSGDVGCAVVEDGLVCWGSNEHEQVARFDGSNRYVSLPVHTVALPPGRKARDVAVGRASFVILDDGSTLSWGAAAQVGRATSLSPDGLPQPVAIEGMTTAIRIDGDNACAAASGLGYCWGAGLPNPPNVPYVDLSRAMPAPIAVAEPVRQVSTMRQRIDPATIRSELPGAMPDRWCAATVTGNVYCWGYNTSGQAGNGTKTHAYEPVKVMGLPAPAVSVEVTFDSTCALLTNGQIYCWGSNVYGQLGTGKFRVASIIPQEVILP